MKVFLLFVFGLFYLLISIAIADDSIEKRIYTTVRAIQSPIIDGKLDEPLWSTVPKGFDFTQHEPHEGDLPTEKTEFQIAYDDQFLYVAIRAFDSHVEEIDDRVTRRDDALNSDKVSILLDSYFDKRTAFEFGVNAGGVKMDMVYSGDGRNEDPNWDPVWFVKTNSDEFGWTAEMKIPFNQIRYANNGKQVWGLEVSRELYREQELSLWQHIPQTSPGFIHMFGELHGIENIPSLKRIELLPYAVGSIERFKKEADNPYADGQNTKMRGGLDGKIGLSSDLTMDFTINPDFGQVEADPSEVNLTAFETFFEEKRPFFVEGNNIFNYKLMLGNGPFSNDMLFYSRRIGRTPQYDPDLEDDEYLDSPQNTSILGALKVSGKTANGWSIGVLDAVTEREKAKISYLGKERKETVEPLSNYFVGRLQKDFNNGASSIGGMVTSSHRKLDDQNLEFLHSSAYSGGLDVRHQWHNQDYSFNLNTAFSQVNGSQEAILETQTRAGHFFQRPDATHLSVDSTATSMVGHGGYLNVGKLGGKWQFAFIGLWRSPGLELNDVGFMRRADFMMDATWLGYRTQKPWWIFRQFFYNIERWTGRNFDNEVLFTGGNTGLHVQFKNYWGLDVGYNIESEGIDVSRLRGGPSIKIPGGGFVFLQINSDERKPIMASLGGFDYESDDNISSVKGLFSEITIRPSQRLHFTLNPEFDIRDVNMQYVTTEEWGNTDRYILARMKQKTLALVFRLNYSVTPNLSIQYYGQPFVAAGNYKDFKRVTESRADRVQDRYHRFNKDEIKLDDDVYRIDEDSDGGGDYSFDKPDFNFRQFLSNLVMRWEYKPGSTIYFVWSQGRTGSESMEISHLEGM